MWDKLLFWDFFGACDLFFDGGEQQRLACEFVTGTPDSALDPLIK